MGDGFREIMARFDPRVRDLAVSARALVEDVYPAVVEVPCGRGRTSSATASARRR